MSVTEPLAMKEGQAKLERALAKALRSARVRQGLTQQALANALEIPRPAVVLVEQARRRVHVAEFCAWARALGLSPAVLIRDLAQALYSACNLVPLDAVELDDADELDDELDAELAIAEGMESLRAALDAPPTEKVRAMIDEMLAKHFDLAAELHGEPSKGGRP